jgi:lipid-A-disaccharide synthase-like uncharacterized protein
LIFGLIFLTKVDILFAAAAVVVFFFSIAWLDERDLKSTMQSAGIFLACSCVPVFMFFGYFVSVMPFGQAVRAVCGSWIGLLGTGVAKNSYYVRLMGLDNPVGNVLAMVYHAVLVIITIGTVFFLSYFLRRCKDKLAVVCLCMALLTATASLVLFVNLYAVGRSLPLLTFLSFLFLFALHVTAQKGYEERGRRLNPMLLLSVFSVFLLLKMILFSRIFHYGFYLALPSAVLLVSMLVWYLPEWFGRMYPGGSVFRIVMLAMIVILSLRFTQTSNRMYKEKNYSIGAGNDRIVTLNRQYDVRSVPADRAVEWIRANLDEKETFVVLPEGVMLNYLTKRVNPTPYTNFMVPEMLRYREDTILDAFKNNSPDFFVLVHKNTMEYGVGFFGQDPSYGKSIMEWINRNYHPVVLFGREPLRGRDFGIKILQRGRNR